MSVIMTMRMKGDPSALEKVAGDDPERIRGIVEKAREHGLIAHRFYGSDDGQIMIIDEWPDPQSFQAFFEQMQPEIGPLMEEVGVSGEPEVKFWRKLETRDEVGWTEQTASAAS